MDYFHSQTGPYRDDVTRLPATETLILSAFVLAAIVLSAVVVGLTFGESWTEWSAWISLSLGPPSAQG
ncbi:hypothetical protein [Sulfitobacter aestuariivivens]|uniref:Uncharacterized protein n=1 Tax=Sulfitobacter aestuariivivens TaxID=2766981 RepID=A0A927HDV2_9RHOB|nr:hypothetical protein [Sulfitobacter aestuariivivens]MBD3662723.1 hypothetical protein [Sulfitobacter aestuariivivens]